MVVAGAGQQGIAMSLTNLDLSNLPEPIRQKLQARLDRLPAHIRGKFLESLGKVPPQMLGPLLEQGSPMLDKLLDRLEQQLPASARSGSASTGTGHAPTQSIADSMSHAPKSLYSQTVQRGDSLSLPVGFIVLILGGALALLYGLGFFGG
jgi:hypothetical protein